MLLFVTMIDNFGRQPEAEPTRAAELESAKNAFHKSMFDNDVFAEVILAGMTPDGASNLEDFACEPTVRFKEDDSRELGVRLASSRTAEYGGLGVCLSFYDHLPLATIDPSTGEPLLDSAFEAALVRAGFPATGDEASSVLESWRDGYNAITQEFNGEITVDPLTRTLTLLAELEGTAIVPPAQQRG